MKMRIGLAAATVAMLSTSVAFASTEVQFWHAMGGKLGEKVAEIAGKFNAAQGDYVVNAVYKGNYTETMTAAIAAFRAREQPHIVQVFEVGTASMMAAKGAVYPVHQLMADTQEPFDQSAYVPAVASYYTSTDGKLLSMPFNSSTPVLWYNKDMLDKAGAKVPTTWDEVFDASAKVKASGGTCGFAVGWQSWVLIENMSAWHNLPIGTKANGFGGTDTEFTFNNDKIIGLLQRIADSQKDGAFKYGGRRSDGAPLFNTGECAMYMNSSASYAGIKANARFNFGQTMLPFMSDVVKAPQNSIIGGATLWVLQGGKPEAYKGVAKFFSFLSSPEIQADWHQATGYVPITTAAYELSKTQGYYDANPGTDIAIRQLSLNAPTANSAGLRFGNFVQIRDIINEELEALWAGQKTAKQAMDAAKSRGDELLRKFQQTN
ncbi:MAG: sn-glycerol-3-phosphate ABC transporter substrate-binding protein UgpB [Pseudomonadota bacterium]|nr:sn-glycerol-3-phosphate ABC transporter substrate-binding protein UgpB [Pseudomonadota bacterium]